ncbi:unnamed protein product [Ixodes hexagonus]
MLVVSSRCHRNHRTRCHSTFWTAMRVRFRQWTRICQPHNGAVLQEVWHRAPSHTSIHPTSKRTCRKGQCDLGEHAEETRFQEPADMGPALAQRIVGNQHRRAKLHRILSIFSFAWVSASPPKGTSHRNYNIRRLPRVSTRHFACCTD